MALSYTVPAVTGYNTFQGVGSSFATVTLNTVGCATAVGQLIYMAITIDAYNVADYGAVLTAPAGWNALTNGANAAPPTGKPQTFIYWKGSTAADVSTGVSFTAKLGPSASAGAFSYAVVLIGTSAVNHRAASVTFDSDVATTGSPITVPAVAANTGEVPVVFIAGAAVTNGSFGYPTASDATDLSGQAISIIATGGNGNAMSAIAVHKTPGTKTYTLTQPMYRMRGQLMIQGKQFGTSSTSRIAASGGVVASGFRSEIPVRSSRTNIGGAGNAIMPATVADGDTLLVFMRATGTVQSGSYVAPTLSAPAGWFQLGTAYATGNSNGGQRIYAFSKQAVAADAGTNISFNPSATASTSFAAYALAVVGSVKTASAAVLGLSGLGSFSLPTVDTDPSDTTYDFFVAEQNLITSTAADTITETPLQSGIFLRSLAVASQTFANSIFINYRSGRIQSPTFTLAPANHFAGWVGVSFYKAEVHVSSGTAKIAASGGMSARRGVYARGPRNGTIAATGGITGKGSRDQQPLSTLVDKFATQIDTTRWTGSVGSTGWTSAGGGRAAMSCTASFLTSRINTDSMYTASGGDQLVARVIYPLPAVGAVVTGWKTGMWLSPGGLSTKRLLLQIEANATVVGYLYDGSSSVPVSQVTVNAAFNRLQDRYLRIRFFNGSWYFSTSFDAVKWNTEKSLAASWLPDKMSVVLFASKLSTDGNYGVSFDNVNVTPVVDFDSIASLTASGGIVGRGFKRKDAVGTATLTSTGNITNGRGLRGQSGRGSLLGTGSITNGHGLARITFHQGSLTGTGAITARAGRRGLSGRGALLSSGTIGNGHGYRTPAGRGTLTGLGSITNGHGLVKILFHQGSLTASGTVRLGRGKRLVGGRGTLTGSGRIWQGTGIKVETPHFEGTATLSASGTVWQERGIADHPHTGTLAASGQVHGGTGESHRFGQGWLIGTGQITALAGTAEESATGYLISTGDITDGHGLHAVDGTGFLTAFATITGCGYSERYEQGQLDATGELHGMGVGRNGRGGPIVGVGSITGATVLDLLPAGPGSYLQDEGFQQTPHRSYVTA